MLKRCWLEYVFVGFVLYVAATVAQAHEFWIEPQDFTLASGEPLVADLKVGQKLKGSTYSFAPDRFESFDLLQGEKKSAVKSLAGDYPAVNEKNLAEGLAILAYASTPRRLSYNQAMKFEVFVKKEGISWVLEQHRQRNLPRKGFVEAYSRFGKTLVKVGSGEGDDRAVGMPFELVMLTNPYTDEGDELAVKLLWEGKPFADSQLSVFFKPEKPEDYKVERVLYKTDEAGVATIPRPAESGLMLLSSVHMIVPDAATVEETKAVWESLWASMTFLVE